MTAADDGRLQEPELLTLYNLSPGFTATQNYEVDFPFPAEVCVLQYHGVITLFKLHDSISGH